jgi:hypothetical protein
MCSENKFNSKAVDNELDTSKHIIETSRTDLLRRAHDDYPLLVVVAFFDRRVQIAFCAQSIAACATNP